MGLEEISPFCEKLEFVAYGSRREPKFILFFQKLRTYGGSFFYILPYYSFQDILLPVTQSHYCNHNKIKLAVNTFDCQSSVLTLNRAEGSSSKIVKNKN